MIDKKQCSACYGETADTCPVRAAISAADGAGSGCSCSEDAAQEVVCHLINGDICEMREALIASGLLRERSFQQVKVLLPNGDLKDYWKKTGLSPAPIVKPGWAGKTKLPDGLIVGVAEKDEA
jgi:hypothetical protein